MKKIKIVLFAIGGGVVVVVLIVWFVLAGPGTDQTPGKKVITDTKAYLMVMSSNLKNNELQLPWCITHGGIIMYKPKCEAEGVDQGVERKPWWPEFKNWPSNLIEQGSSGGGCTC